MYSLGQIAKAIGNPRTIARELNRLAHTRGYTRSYNEKGISIFEEDWDNLIIFDACRFDYFEQESDLSGTLECRISRGSTTSEFVRANFSGRQCYDTVYLSSNSWYLKLRDKIDAELFRYIDLQDEERDIHFYEKSLGVPEPGCVTDTAIEQSQKYPKKRLIVHYLQPHQPYLGPTGEQYYPYRSDSLADVLKESKEGATLESLRAAYIENLNIALSEAERLIETLPGKTAVTADHGEMLGDRHTYVPVRDFGHHKGIYNRPLVEVPWHVSQKGPRKEIVAEQPEHIIDVGQEEIDGRLRNLGYKL